MWTLLIAHIAALLMLVSMMEDDTSTSVQEVRTSMSELEVPWPNLTPTPRPSYGRVQSDPINVGGRFATGVANQYRYLNTLRGPKGERCMFARRGSCCPFPLPDAEEGEAGLLDVYIVEYEGLATPDTLYLNIYTSSTVYIPTGYTARK